MRGCVLLKRVELPEQSKSPFHILVRDTMRNDTKNPSIFYNDMGNRVIVRPGTTETFTHYIEKRLKGKTVRLEKTPKWRQV